MKTLDYAVLVADDERNTREAMARYLRSRFSFVATAEDGETALNMLKNRRYDLVLTDLRMPKADGMAVLYRCTAMGEEAPLCIMLTAYGTVESAVEAVKAGAFDFVTKPVNLDKLELVLNRAIETRELKRENKLLKQALQKDSRAINQIICVAPPMCAVVELVRQIAPTRSTVLIYGESGTGKELVAQAIHQESRRKGPFVAVNCSALSSNLLESELFGHERGAFTGAVEQRKGRFELADGGTIFLDEIGEIDQSVQVKLLRVLETRSFERVGGTENINVDVRILAATNKDLLELIKEGKFREDLYYRLNVVELTLPPLRDRIEDIPLLVRHFIDNANIEHGKSVKSIREEALDILMRYDWPGNIRELKNCIERMVVLALDKVLTVDNVPLHIRDNGRNVPRGTVSLPASQLALADQERVLVERALAESNGNRTHAAEKLGISRRTLLRRIKEYGI